MHDAAAYRVLRNYIDETNVPLNAPLAYFNWIQGGLERLEGMWINEQWSAGRKLLAPESYNSQRYNDGFDSVTLELWPNVDKLIKLAMLDLRGKNPEWAHCLNDSYTQVPELEFTQAQIQRLLSIHDQLLRRYEPKNPSPYNEFGTWCGSLAGVFLDKAKDRAKVIQAIHAMGSKASKPMKAFAQYLTHRGE
jgi:hypothetical protein